MTEAAKGLEALQIWELTSRSEPQSSCTMLPRYTGDGLNGRLIREKVNGCRLCTSIRRKDCHVLGLGTAVRQTKVPTVGGQTDEHGYKVIPRVNQQSHVISILQVVVIQYLQLAITITV